MIEYEKINFGQNACWNIDEISTENTIQKRKKGVGTRCSNICKQKTLADQNSKSHFKRCWTAWNSTFSHRFWTIFSEPKSSDRDAYDAMVKIAYFQLIRTKESHSALKKTAGGQKKPEPNAVSRHRSDVSRHWKSIQEHCKSIQEHRKDTQEAFRKHLKLFPELKRNKHI